ncbi:anthranilate synthase component I [Maritalea mediterranea]|uniref:Anthranilate synthase component 1 n=1 Tax=Maritalea mediterranea TaxID=2909667 RepID=A0ABS9E6U5_9HYPH|nr:anthranilate synthase component I [Maritalea mediterranea]MCF4098537.1 anthranilate synthase component I [Maritalea mediterranea]
MQNTDYAAFASIYEKGGSQIMWRRIVADLETPIGTYLKLAAGRKNTFLLESVHGGATRGRYSMIGMEPDLLFRIDRGKAAVNRNPKFQPDQFEPMSGKPLDALREILAESALEIPLDLPPMSAGIFGYLGYDMVREMEDIPDTKEDTIGAPDALLMRPSILAVFDTIKDELYFATPVRPQADVTAKMAFETANARLDDATQRLNEPVQRGGTEEKSADLNFESNTTPDQFKQIVAKAKDYIVDGDIFQVVLSQRFTADFTLPPVAFYRALRRTNPSPYMYFLDFEGFAIAGSSPEILVRVQDEKVSIRPIAGTRKRGSTPERDRELADELLNDPKELAEHLMLLDLGRNDVGRVAEIGSVEVTDSFFLEYYSHVMHIVSNVEGKLKKGLDNIDALSGGFPAGTVSGAPKVRAMEIIDELEKHRRGIYAGCVGYFSADGWMDTCIVLRTAVIKDGKIHVQAGAGIVADSDPKLEQLECENKARALVSAAHEALRYADEAEIGQ